MKTMIRTLFAVFALFAVNVFAADLTTAKEQGLIGELYTGYIGIVKNADPEVEALVAETNLKRKKHYQNIAAERNTTLDKVELVAGAAAIKKTLAGNFIKLEGEDWRKK